MIKHITTAAALTIGFATLGTALPASAETMQLKAELSGTSETPPNTSKGEGMLTGSYDSADKMLTYSVTYSGLSGPATAAHFHGPAGPGKSAGVEVPVKGALASPVKGTATLTAKQAADLMAGNVYFNIHTAEHKAGELRGQVTAAK